MKFSIIIATISILMNSHSLAHDEHPKAEAEEGAKVAENTVVDYVQPPITHSVDIQPYLVAKSDGSDVTNKEEKFIRESTQKIMNQAGIKVNFLPAKIYKSDVMWSGLFSKENNVEEELAKSPAKKEKKFISLFFVQKIDPDGRVGGMAQEGGNTIFIAEWALKRKVQHVIAHELCHNLGLGHENFDSNISGDRKKGKNVMYGNEPYKIEDVYPDGKQLSQLNPKQVAQMLKHPAVKKIVAKEADEPVLEE